MQDKQMSAVQCFVYLTCLVYSAAAKESIIQNRVNVSIHEGKLIGIVEEDGYGGNYFAFRGIPYAKPPIGELRFKDPVPVEPWSGYRDASTYGNISVQYDVLSHQIVGDEDCLYLNVYTTDLEPSEKRAVMVWIHGGGFFTGSGDATLYGPEHIIRKDIVLVTLNYRLAVLGFLNLDDEVATGNQALKDVVMALKWVQRNIAKFGGNPGSVTIFGESAGGVIVNYMTLSPLAEGLFHKAISQSGVFADPWAFASTNDEIKLGITFTQKLGKNTTDPKIAYEFLKTIGAKVLVGVELSALLVLTEHHLTFKPSIDSKSPNPFLPEHPSTLIRRGIKVPFLLGHNSHEGIFFADSKFFGRISDEYFKQVDSDFKLAGLPIVWSKLSGMSLTPEDIRYLYFRTKSVSRETLMNYSDFLGDQFVYRGNMEIANILAKQNNRTYLYNFSYSNATSFIRTIFDIRLPGPTHFEELGYLFCPSAMKNSGLPAPDSDDYKMINVLTQLWTDFAKTGNPTPAVTDLCPVKWTPLKNGNVYDYLDINIKPQMKACRKGEQRWDWQNRINKLYHVVAYSCKHNIQLHCVN